MRNILIFWLSIAALSGCSNPGIVKLSPDTYMLSREAHGGIFASASALKAGVINDANAFTESQGKVAIPLSAKEIPMDTGPAQWASFEYQFRVVDKNDPEVRRTSLVPRPDVVIEKTEKITADVKTKDQTDRPKDVYAELVKLDDLRKRGILTDAEFEVQKKALGRQMIALKIKRPNPAFNTDLRVAARSSSGYANVRSLVEPTA